MGMGQVNVDDQQRGVSGVWLHVCDDGAALLASSMLSAMTFRFRRQRRSTDFSMARYLVCGCLVGGCLCISTGGQVPPLVHDDIKRAKRNQRLHHPLQSAAHVRSSDSINSSTPRLANVAPLLVMADRPQTPVAPSPSPSPSNYYLRAYNFVSATYWFVILARVARFVIEHGFEHVYAGVGDKAKWVQTMAVLEIAHAAIGTGT